MKKPIRIFVLCFLFSLQLHCQNSIVKDLEKIPGITITKKENTYYNEYYEIFIDQVLDHFDQKSKKFRQRIIIGVNDVSAPIVIESDGYSIEHAEMKWFNNEPASRINANMMIVEHRYYGKSVPDTMNWNFLTIKQAACDLHQIRILFSELFKGKWISSGISKGGQTAIAYRMYFPRDVSATIAYATPVKNGLNDSRFSDYFNSLSGSECGKKVLAFQLTCFKNKPALLKEFDKYVATKKYTFKKMSNETVLEYLLLEYPFSFFQRCSDCKQIPDTMQSPEIMLQAILKDVSPKYFSDPFRKKMEPSFYMFYHELGYYEYEIEKLRPWLKNTRYPNNILAPDNANITFDPSYLSSINAFINDPATEKLLFIYGESDPYLSVQANTGNNKNCLKVVVKNACHKARISDLPDDKIRELVKVLTDWIK